MRGPVEEDSFVVGAVTWAEVVQNARHRLAFVKQALDYQSTVDAGIQYLQRAHGEYLAAACLSPFYAAANPAKDTVSPIPIVGNGWRSYSVGLSSYLRRCGGYVYARHCLYIDTRNLPYGHQVWFTVSTQRSDGKWAPAHAAPILSIAGKQKIQEVCLRQRRGVVVAGKQLTITQVHVRHTATTPGDGALIPRGSTLKGVYEPCNGPEAKPAR